MSASPEYNEMIVELEKFHKEYSSFNERNERRELDLRYRLLPLIDVSIGSYCYIILKLADIWLL